MAQARRESGGEINICRKLRRERKAAGPETKLDEIQWPIFVEGGSEPIDRTVCYTSVDSVRRCSWKPVERM